MQKHNVQYRQNGQCKTNVVVIPIILTYVFINIVNDEEMFDSVFQSVFSVGEWLNWLLRFLNIMILSSIYTNKYDDDD